MQCTFCPQDTLAHAYSGPKLMTRETFDAVLHNAGKVDVYSFAGFAEPYLHPQCSEMILRCADRAPVKLYTTGVGMTPADVEAVRGRLQFVVVHLPDAAGHMKYTPTPAYLKTLDALKRSGMDVRWMSMGDAHSGVLPITGPIPGAMMQNRAGNVTHMVQLAKRGPLKCRPAPNLDHPVVLPSGEVVACCQDYSLRHVLGNLSEQTWAQVYAGEAFQELVAAMADGDCLCRGCQFAEFA